jgi:integrase
MLRLGSWTKHCWAESRNGSADFEYDYNTDKWTCVHLKAISDLLGHHSVSITADLYGHTSDETARRAVEGWSGALGL